MTFGQQHLIPNQAKLFSENLRPVQNLQSSRFAIGMPKL